MVKLLFFRFREKILLIVILLRSITFDIYLSIFGYAGFQWLMQVQQHIY